jgi:rubrerythrin
LTLIFKNKPHLEETMAKKVYTCQTCGALAEEPGHLCNPNMEPMTCAFCGATAPHTKHYCKGKLEDIKFVCNKCGRLAISEDLLCEPTKVPTA